MKLSALEPYVERAPRLAASYRAVRDIFADRSARPQQTPYGFRFSGHRAMEERTFEPVETALIIDKLSETDVFVDVGSNIGFYACLARSRGVRTIAVEPHPFNLRRLYANLSDNGWHDVEIFPVGLGASPRLAHLYGEGTGASVVEGWASTSKVHRRLIPLLTLDLVFGKRYRDQRVFVKVDVEGLEKDVLLGATDTLAHLKHATWLVEICLTDHHPGGMNPVFSDIFDLFWSSGYRASALDQGPGTAGRLRAFIAGPAC